MDRDVLNHILNGVVSVDSYFQQIYDCIGLRGLSVLQKVVVEMHILTYGLPADAIAEYVQIGESTAHESLDHLCRAVIDAFGKSTYILRTLLM
jgi:hypothetical protein